MNHLTFEFSTPEIKTEFDWQLSQELNVYEGETLIAKAEFEVLTLNKNRGAKESYQKLEQLGPCDWELPLNLFFTKQNLKDDLAQRLTVSTNVKKAQQHIMLEAIAVLPDYRKQDIANRLLKQIAEQYATAQSIFTIALPMASFVDPEACEIEQDQAFYQKLQLSEDKSTNEDIAQFFEHNGFIRLEIDNELLAEPLPYQLLVSSPALINQ